MCNFALSEKIKADFLRYMYIESGVAFWRKYLYLILLALLQSYQPRLFYPLELFYG